MITHFSICLKIQPILPKPEEENFYTFLAKVDMQNIQKKPIFRVFSNAVYTFLNAAFCKPFKIKH